MPYAENEDRIPYPVVSDKGLRFVRGKMAVLRTHGVPDIKKDLGKAIKLLSEPGSKARVKWEGDTEWTTYGDPA